MPFGTDIDLGPGHIVLYGDSVPHENWSTVPSPSFAVYGCRQAFGRINRDLCHLWPNGWIDQDATWYGGRS